MNILAISDFVDKIKSIMVNLLEWLKNFASGSMWWAAMLIFLFAAILMLIGLIRLIVKSWKLFLVLIILAAIGFVVYWFVWGPGKKTPSTTTEAEAIITSLKLVKNLVI